MSDTFKYQKYFIKSAPYGELPDVLANLQKLSNVQAQTHEMQEALQQYNQQHLTLVPTSANQNFMITKVSRNSDGTYSDQKNKKVYKVNHLTKQIINTSHLQVQLPEPVEELLQNLSQKIEVYVAKFYRDPQGSQIFMYIDEQTGLDIHVAFTAKHINLANNYTGQWTSLWKINKQKITGQVAVKAHFFQSGNVQLNQNKQLEKEFQFTADMNQNGTKIVQIIQAFEQGIQSGLQQVYQNMQNGFFKHLRRITPYTKTKMNWNLNALKMNKNLIENNGK